MPNERPPFWTPRTVVGLLAFLTGIAFAAWMLHDRTLTWQGLCACFFVSGAGAYILEPTLVHGYLAEVRDAVPWLTAVRSGRRETDPVVVTTDVSAPSGQPEAPRGPTP